MEELMKYVDEVYDTVKHGEHIPEDVMFETRGEEDVYDLMNTYFLDVLVKMKQKLEVLKNEMETEKKAEQTLRL